MDQHVWFGTAFTSDALPDTAPIFIPAWDWHYDYTSLWPPEAGFVSPPDLESVLTTTPWNQNGPTVEKKNSKLLEIFQSFQFTQEVSTTILDGVHFLLLR